MWDKKKNTISSFISDQNKVDAQMLHRLLIHRRGHSSVVFRISINCSAMGAGVGAWKKRGLKRGCPSMHVLQGQVSGTGTKLGGGWGEGGQLSSSMHTQEILAACTQLKTTSFSTGWIFQKQFLGGRQTARWDHFEGMVCANLSCLFSAQTAACCRRTREQGCDCSLIMFSEPNATSSDVLFTPNGPKPKKMHFHLI